MQPVGLLVLSTDDQGDLKPMVINPAVDHFVVAREHFPPNWEDIALEAEKTPGIVPVGLIMRADDTGPQRVW